MHLLLHIEERHRQNLHMKLQGEATSNIEYYYDIDNDSVLMQSIGQRR